MYNELGFVLLLKKIYQFNMYFVEKLLNILMDAVIWKDLKVEFLNSKAQSFPYWRFQQIDKLLTANFIKRNILHKKIKQKIGQQ